MLASNSTSTVSSLRQEAATINYGSVPDECRVGERRALRQVWGVAVCRQLSLCVGASVLTMATFPRPRSSNWTCGIPATSLPTRSCLRPRKALGLRRKVYQAIDRPQPFVREARVLPALDLVLPTEPLSQPLRRMRIQCRVGGADLSEVIVVRLQGLRALLKDSEPPLEILNWRSSVNCWRLAKGKTWSLRSRRSTFAVTRQDPDDVEIIRRAKRPRRCHSEVVGTEQKNTLAALRSLTNSGNRPSQTGNPEKRVGHATARNTRQLYRADPGQPESGWNHTCR